jgi:hypothetical protein
MFSDFFCPEIPVLSATAISVTVLSATAISVTAISATAISATVFSVTAISPPLAAFTHRLLKRCVCPRHYSPENPGIEKGI